MISNRIHVVLDEVGTVLGKVQDQEALVFLKEIRAARHIAIVGAGRVGYAMRGFAMRLAHLGLDAHMVGDATVPSIGRGDLLIVASGSGETQTIYDLVVRAHEDGARVALITGNPGSRMGKSADVILLLPAPSKTKAIAGFVSEQPMTTLNEQCLGILCDAMVLELMQEMSETHDTMWARHSNLE